jgi:pimeloyl-ACP methyl ester carboxylesterase
MARRGGRRRSSLRSPKSRWSVCTTGSFDDLVGVLDGVLDALELEPPYVVAGPSFGGNIAIAYAVAHPDRVAALVSIEAYHDDPAEMAAWQAEEGFTWADNAEHFDVVPASSHQDAYPMPVGAFPVLIISATQADPGVSRIRRTGWDSRPIPGRW